MSFKRMFQTVETHTGLATRVVTGGVPHIPGNSVYEQMLWLKENDDQIRLLMLKEPRGLPPSCCNVIVPPKDPRAAMGFIIFEQIEYPLMSGSNAFCVTTALLETGILPMQEPVSEFFLEAPAGLIAIKAECANGKVTKVTLKNVPAFAAHLDAVIEVPHLGKVTVDVGWGGMFYVIADVRQFKGLELIPKHGAEITKICSMIRAAAHEQLPVRHPDYPSIGITIAQLTGPTDNPDADAKNVVAMGTGELDWNNPATWSGAIDRSPCGTGTCARMATMHAKGQLPLHKPFRHEGILGTIYTGELLEETKIGDFKAVVPTIAGQAWVTGYSTYILDSTDPLTHGFTVGDIWQ